MQYPYNDQKQNTLSPLEFQSPNLVILGVSCTVEMATVT